MVTQPLEFNMAQVHWKEQTKRAHTACRGPQAPQSGQMSFCKGAVSVAENRCNITQHNTTAFIFRALQLFFHRRIGDITIPDL